MQRVKFIFTISITVLIFLSCSIVNKLKEKISTAKEELSKKEIMKDVSSADEMNFYNTYIEEMNKIQDAGDGVNSKYISDIPDPGSITKNSFMVPISFSIATQTLGSLVKSLKRSYYDGGELSKMTAPEDMKNDIEGNFKSVLSAMEEYSVISRKVSAYYSDYDYKKDLSKVKPYDEEMKSSYEKYKSAFTKFSASIRKYKPKRDTRDPGTISNPDERSSTIVVNAYGDILESAEGFYDAFNVLTYKGDYTEANKKLGEYERTFVDNRHTLLNSDYTDRTKFMKYSFEDYFAPTAEDFISTGKKFFADAPTAKNDNDFKKSFNSVIEDYNRMIDSYNTNISTVNRVRSW